MAFSWRYVAFFLLLVAQAATAVRDGSWKAGFDLSVVSDDNVTRE